MTKRDREGRGGAWRWVAGVLAVVVGAACGGPRIDTSVAPPRVASAARGPELRLVVDERAREVVVDMGPFEVPDVAPGDAHTSHGGAPDGSPAAHGHAGPLMGFEWPVEGWLRGFQVRVTDQEGNELPRDILHHVIGVNFDRRQLAYPALERFFGIGTETRDVELPPEIGVPMAVGQQLAFYTSLHNDTGRDLHGVHVRIAMDYTLRSERDDVTEVLPVYFDTDNRVGGDNMWDVPPGRSEKAWEFTLPVGGSLLGVTGHLHDYGEHVRLEDAATGEVLVRLEGLKDEDGSLLSVETRIFRKWLGLRSSPLRLEAGRRYRVVGAYESPLDETLADGAMAHIVGIFAPDDMSRWPALDAENELLLLDAAALPPAVGEGPRAHAHDGAGSPPHGH